MQTFAPMRMIGFVFDLVLEQRDADTPICVS